MPEDDAEQTPPEAEHKKTLREKLHEHLLAAEVAAEESAGYGAGTTAVEATEAAIDPEHELGDDDDDSGKQQEPVAPEQPPEH